MKKFPLIFLWLLSLALPMSAATDGKFSFAYPAAEDLPYSLGYQYSIYDLGESDTEGWKVMELNEPVTLTYNIISESEKTVEVVFDPSYLEIKDIVIPEIAIDPQTGIEYTVVAIGKMAFDDCPEIRSVIMGNSITRIEDYAFNMCDNKILHNIGYIKFSENLTHIGNYAFKNCHNLTTGHYTEGNQWPIMPFNFLKNVDDPIYGYAGRLTGLDNYLLLPASVEYIGKHAFEGCYFEREDNHLNYGLCKVKIPNRSCVIDDYAFAGCRFLELVTIGDELTHEGLTDAELPVDAKGRIGDYAFANCNLMRLDIPSSIESIGENAFINSFNKSRYKTPRSLDGRVYFDALNWFYPRSLFDTDSDFWHSWNFGTSDHEDIWEKCDKYLNQWHTNTVTIHSDKTVIGINAFANNPQLETVIIKGDAGEIGSGAFLNCTNLTRVELPDNLTHISSSMFMNCSELTSIQFPGDIREIGDSAFYRCVKLAEIELPAYLQEIKPYTFYECNHLIFSVLPGEIHSIGDYAFYGCRAIEAITIPDNVTSIGDYAFAECYIHSYMRHPTGDRWFYGLKEVTIGEGVKTIGAHAFDGCRHLGHIEFGNSVETIGEYAFRACMSCPEDKCDAEYAEVVLPGSVTSIGAGVFQDCTQIPAITLSENIESIPEFAFAFCSNLSSLNNVSPEASISKTALIGCYQLQGFDSLLSEEGLEDGIYYDGDEVIAALPNIESAVIREGTTKIREGAFAHCGLLTEIIFPESLQYIGARAFANCTALETARLVNIDEMGDSVYYGCTGITEVFIPADYIKDLRDNWFEGCENMYWIEVDEDNPRYASEEGLLLNHQRDTVLRAPSGIDWVEFPSTVTTIGEYAFANCNRFEEVYIPETVTHIGAHAFDNCGGEEYSGLMYVTFDNPAVSIGAYAFNNCINLTEIWWEESFPTEDRGSIGAYAFNNCQKIEFSKNTNFSTGALIDTLEPYAFANFQSDDNKSIELILPETLETIGDHAFDSYYNLTSVIFPEGLKKIGNSAFMSTPLTFLDLPDAIEEIGDSAFMNCSNVMELKLPAGLKKINPYTFYKCFSGALFREEPREHFNLSIEIPESVESIGDYAFYGCTVDAKEYSRENDKQTYSGFYYVYNYGISSLSIGDNVTSIGAHAFDGCTHLLSVTLGNSVTSIGDYAFKNCFRESFQGAREVEYTITGYIVDKGGLTAYPPKWNLDETIPEPIALPEGLVSLGEGAFKGCGELPAVTFPASLTVIPDWAFSGCENLPEITLGDNLTEIGSYAFEGCSGVTEIHIPASLNKGSRSFVDCDKALKVYYYAEEPKSFDEGFFSPKVYANKEAVVYAPNAPLESMKTMTPWVLFYKIEAKDEEIEHLENALETKNNLTFRILSNKPTPYCEVAGPATPASGPTTYTVPEYVKNIDPASEYFGMSYKVIRIGNDAFENDLNLVGIDIPEGVLDIGQEAFAGCKNLPEINLPNSITNIGERAFANCYGLTYFVVPPLVTRLNHEVLRDCRGLYSVRMHDNIEELCTGALMDCRHLRAFERSENWNLRLIDDYALKNCIELENINIPEGVTKIGREAMYYCQKLKIASLPKSLLELGENAFDDCEVLNTIKIYTEITPKILGEANLTEPHCKIFVQAKCLDDYRELWQVHAHRIEPGIIITQPTRKEMPEYIPGSTYRLTEKRPLEGQVMTWSAINDMVASEPGSHDGLMELNGVGRTPIHVETDLNYYHDITLDVYPRRADANWDGGFDISDAVNIAHYAVMNQGILVNWWETRRPDFADEDEWMEFYIVGADVNGDGGISFADASATVKVILDMDPENVKAQSVAHPAAFGADDFYADALTVSPAVYDAPSRVTIPVGLDNSKQYVALQANIRVAEGATLVDVKPGKRADGHKISYRRIDDRTMRIALFDINGSAFINSNESILELVVEGKSIDTSDIEIYGIVASDITSQSHALTLRAGDIDLAGTSKVTIDDTILTPEPDGLTVSGARGKKIVVSNLLGQIVSSFTVSADPQTIRLDKGIYIIAIDGAGAAKIAVK